LSQKNENEPVEPFLRSVVTVTDAQTVTGNARFDYLASADTGNPLLKVSGTLENLTNQEMNGGASHRCRRLPKCETCRPRPMPAMRRST
jgi:hypothetical protein